MTEGLTMLIEYLRNIQRNKTLGPWPRLQPLVGTGLTQTGKELLDLLRIKEALDRIEATGARYDIRHKPNTGWSPLFILMPDGLSTALGRSGTPLTAAVAEAGAAWSEAQVVPKVANCPCCGKRCE